MNLLLQELSKKKKLYSLNVKRNLKAKIFSIKKLKRNGLLEKKQLKLLTTLKRGRWTREEHKRFLKACLLYGSKWRKIHEAVKTRTSAQVRSHAQKYVIKLCKKYDIEIKSKRKSCFLSAHLNFPYRRKNKKNILPLEKMSKDDRKILKNFNFYIKLVDIDKVEENNCNEKVFKIDKSGKSNEENANNSFSNSFPITTKQDENFEENSDFSCMFKSNNNNINTDNNNTSFNKQLFLNDNNNSCHIFNKINNNIVDNGFSFCNMYSKTNELVDENNAFENNGVLNKSINNYFNRSAVLSDLNKLNVNNLVNINFLRKNNNAETFNQEYLLWLDYFRENFYNNEH